jgi:CRISPR/Cas system-associated exonuclease Cas4 (RecB family)
LEKSVVLEVVYYQTNEELFEAFSALSSCLIIAPSPLIADNLRALNPNAEVLTISKWVSDHLKIQGKNRIRKSDLMVKLAAVWRHYFPEQKPALFREAFDLFTELRSFTLNLELLAEFFKELEADLVKSLLLFWTYLDQEKLIDEHLGYFETSLVEDNRPLMFVGFKHLSGVQIDMIKRLSDSQEVYVSFPADILEDVQNYDWITWLDSNPPQIEKESFYQKLQLTLLPKGMANFIISEQLKESNVDLVMATTNAQFLSMQEIYKTGSFFKASEDLFASDREWLLEELKKIVLKEKVSEIIEIQIKLLELTIPLLKVGEYRKYKMAELAGEILKMYQEVRSDLDSFGLDILSEALALNSPRSSFVSLEKSIKGNIADINGLNFKDGKKTAIVATAAMGGFRAGEKTLSEAMTKALRPIGPIKRAGLDYLFYKNDIIRTFASGESFLFIEESLIESDLSWREILKEFEIEKVEAQLPSMRKKGVDYLKSKMKSGPFSFKTFSASSLQSYLDCPRKYYFSFVQRIDNEPELKMTLGPSELGQIEHAVIAAYFDEFEVLNEEINLERHQKLCSELLLKKLAEGKFHLSETEKAKCLNEILHFSLNGIMFLSSFVKNQEAESILFEVPLAMESHQLKGSIDCVIKLKNGSTAVFDFKRSAGAAGSKNDTLEMRKIQLWVYLYSLNTNNYKISDFGYINLSDLNDDKLIFSGEKSIELLNANLPKAETLLVNLIKEINAAKDFPARPIDNKACRYCPVSLFCHKGELQ